MPVPVVQQCQSTEGNCVFTLTHNRLLFNMSTFAEFSRSNRMPQRKMLEDCWRNCFTSHVFFLSPRHQHQCTN